MFAPGEVLEVRTTARSEHDAVLRVAREPLGVIAFSAGARSARLTIQERSWHVRGYAPGWRVAAFDVDGIVAAAYSDRWLLAGRLWVGPTEASVHIPLAWRSWTVRADGVRLLVLDRSGPLRLAGTLGTLPASSDHELLVGFAATVIWLRVRFRTRPLTPVHVTEGRAETLDELLGADIDVGLGGEDVTL